MSDPAIFFRWVNDVSDVKDRVIPPGEELPRKEGFILYDRIGFTDALELAVYFRDEEDSPVLLLELTRLYPADVEALIGVVEDHVRTRSGEPVPA